MLVVFALDQSGLLNAARFKNGIFSSPFHSWIGVNGIFNTFGNVSAFPSISINTAPSLILGPALFY